MRSSSVVEKHHFHLHLISDSTGETLLTAGRAVVAQYENIFPVEHLYPLVRNEDQLISIVAEIEKTPGIVLYTLVDDQLSDRLAQECRHKGIPSLSILEPIHHLFRAYLGFSPTPRPGAQHVLNSEYFRRIEALNFTMLHDDGQHMDRLKHADVILLGVSRTSKTPTSIYLANRGVKTANVPLVPHMELPPQLLTLTEPLIVGLIASPERIVQIRQNRLLGLQAVQESAYVDKFSVAEEMARAKKIFMENKWPVIDVTRRSIEETAAAILDLQKAHKSKFQKEI